MILSSKNEPGFRVNKTKQMKNLEVLFDNWVESKEKMRLQFSVLTVSDLLFVDGKEDEMIHRIQNRLGKSKEEIYQLIEGLE